MDTAKLKISCDTSSIEAAAKSLERLTVAAEKASAALDDLGGKAHGGIHVEVIGSIAFCDVKPPEST